MDEILRGLSSGARVLDLAAQRGSFPAGDYDVRVVRADLDAPPSTAGAEAVQADAAALPFANDAFEAVVCNHGLEHFIELERAVAEIRRVLRPGGSLFLSAPDAGTLTDRLYRFFASGGGHVNPFRRPEDVARLFDGLPLRGVRVLHSSLSFLHPANRGSRRNRRFWLLFGAGERALRWAAWLFRRCDRLQGTRLSVYGWAFYLGAELPAPVPPPWPNVCIRCGSAHPVEGLRVRGWPAAYECPRCGTRNLFTGG